MKQPRRLLVLLLTVSLFSAAHAARYTYDPLHRLTAVTYDGGDSVYYHYDPAGNLLRVRVEVPEPEYRLSGVVSDADGNPLGGALVMLSDGRSVVTGADGGYRFDGLEPGDYSLTVSLDGWENQTHGITLTRDNPVAEIALGLLPLQGRPVLFAGAKSYARRAPSRIFVLDTQGAPLSRSVGTQLLRGSTM